MCGNDLITFGDFSEFPAGNEIGDAAALLDFADDDLGDELAIAADEQFAVNLRAFIFPNIQHDKVPLRIGDQNFALEVGAHGDGTIGSAQPFQFRFGFIVGDLDDFLFSLRHFQGVLGFFDLFAQASDLGRVKPVAS